MIIIKGVKINKWSAVLKIMNILDITTWAEFQTTARRDKKAFLSEQCKELEENNKIGKTRDLFKKIRDTRGAFHAKMGIIKNQNRSRGY